MESSQNLCYDIIMKIKTCPFVELCGGCSLDFTSDSYRDEKLKILPQLNWTSAPIWGDAGTRRRCEFAFDGTHFGFYKNHSKDIIDITNCPNLMTEINAVLPRIAKLPWNCAGSVLITRCENGIDVAVTSIVPHFGAEFRCAVEKLPPQIIKFVWNDTEIRKYTIPQIKFDDKIMDYPPNAFLQPTEGTEKILRDMVVDAVDGAKKVADLFCGLGNFTFATKAIGFDIVGNGIKRDLFKNPLCAKQLNNYDVVIMDPPRAGAEAQSKELAKSEVKKIIYVSCNPHTFVRDMKILENARYKAVTLIPVDQFIGTSHWEIFSVFTFQPSKN